MSGSARFWRNLGLIGLAHVALVTGFVRWSHDARKPDAANITWLGGVASEEGVSTAKATPLPRPVRISAPPPEIKPDDEEEQADAPMLTAAKSEIQLPTPTPKPTLTPAVTPSPNPKPSPKVKVPPKPTPKPKASPKPTPKPSSKKMILAKASPKPRPTPEKKEEDVDLTKKKVAEEEVATKSDIDTADKSETAPAPSGHGKGTSAGTGGRGGGATIQSQFGWYGSMLHDRFYSEWAQPTSVAANSKMSALVKIRISRDGHVTSFEIVRPSGNDAVDQSINAVAKRVTQVDPLPAGLGSGDHYDVKINFELNSD